MRIFVIYMQPYHFHGPKILNKNFCTWTLWNFILFSSTFLSCLKYSLISQFSKAICSSHWYPLLLVLHFRYALHFLVQSGLAYGVMIFTSVEHMHKWVPTSQSSPPSIRPASSNKKNIVKSNMFQNSQQATASSPYIIHLALQ